MENFMDSPSEPTSEKSKEQYRSDTLHPRISQFKVKTCKISQEHRRKKTLEIQKQNRYDYHNHCRKLADNDFTDDSNDSDDGIAEDIEDMEWLPPKIKTPRTYQNQIMLSEWLLEVPDDFESNWLALPCPSGKRCLVVASRGSTKVYSKSGYLITKFQSLLPGGHRKSSNNTILDCLWNESKHCYFVLDVLSWSGVPLLGCEAQLRFFWVSSKFCELPELGTKSGRNSYPFVTLPFIPCIKEKIEELLMVEQENWSPLDGILFYHKLGFYTPNVSSLVGWLKPYMIPEILQAKVADVYMQSKPTNYVNIQQHVMKKIDKKCTS